MMKIILTHIPIDSKTEYYTYIQTSFCDINANNASQGLREKLHLPIWCKNMVGNTGTKM